MANFFNKNLKYIRQLKGTSQQELANKLNIDRSQFQNGKIMKLIFQLKTLLKLHTFSIYLLKYLLLKT